MNLKPYLNDFIMIFIVTFVTTVVVTLLFNLIAHNEAVIDWGTAFRFGLIFGVVLAWTKKK